MALAPGARLGPYEVVSLLGAGGMGEVYRARDPRLGRDVAIKVLPSHFARDDHRRRRFLQEARAASALNHPGIVSIHELESVDGVDLIVMEHVAGRTLDVLIRSGLRLEDALRIAVAVADALAAAHAVGIVHRDVKPANVMVTPEGTVKMLDFGLVKLVDTDSGSAEDETTVSEVLRQRPLSGTGMIAGTPGYMSPEQATGSKVDARSDIFSFGALLYEMVTGRRAFAGSSRDETLRAVVMQPTRAPSELVPGFPAALEKLILRCLRKEPERRFQHIGDVRLELQDIQEESHSATKARSVATSRVGRRLAVVAGLGLLLVVVLAGWRFWRVTGVSTKAPRLVPLTAYKGAEQDPALSPDGEQLAFAWAGEQVPRGERPTNHIWLKLVGGSEERQLTSGPDGDSYPSWSPDGRLLAFLRRSITSPTGATYTIHFVSPLGGAARALGDFRAAYSQLAWTPDGKWVVAAQEGRGRQDDPAQGAIHLLSLAGEPARILAQPTSGGFNIFPAVSPDGGRLAYASCLPAAAMNPCDLQILPLDGSGPGAPRRLPLKPTRVAGLAWAPDGRSLLYAVHSSPGSSGLWRIDVSGSRPAERVELAGSNAFDPSVAARRNRLAFTRSQGYGRLRALDKAGSEGPALASVVGSAPAFSPDGRRIAFQSRRAGEDNDIWLADADGSNPTRLTRDLGSWQGSPRWSPDGRRIVFEAFGGDGYADVWTIDVAGGAPRRVTRGPLTEGQGAWSPDGRYIYYREDRPDGSDIWRVPDRGGEAERVTQAGGYNPLPLADGRTLLYTRARFRAPLVSRSLETGVEREIVECVLGRDFDAAAGGLFYVACPEANDRYPLYRLDHTTGRRQLLARLGETNLDGIAVSPLGQTVLYVDVTVESELVLVENFQ